jgi:vitamin-K-epoxide reductase (warfarin-sensitive)
MPEVRRVKAAAEERHAADRAGLTIGPMHAVMVSARRIRVGLDRIISTDMRYLILFLALLGVVDSALALHVHYDTGVEPCDINARWDCGIVNHSSFAEVKPTHIPVAAVGIVGYLAMAALAFTRRRLLLAIAAIGGFGYALYLSNIEKNVLEVWCLYCVISQGLVALIMLLSVIWYAMAKLKSRQAA